MITSVKPEAFWNCGCIELNFQQELAERTEKKPLLSPVQLYSPTPASYRPKSMRAPFLCQRPLRGLPRLGIHSYDGPGGQGGDYPEGQIYQQQVEREHWPSLPKPAKPRAAHRQKD